MFLLFISIFMVGFEMHVLQYNDFYLFPPRLALRAFNNRSSSWKQIQKLDKGDFLGDGNTWVVIAVQMENVIVMCLSLEKSQSESCHQVFSNFRNNFCVRDV